MGDFVLPKAISNALNKGQHVTERDTYNRDGQLRAQLARDNADKKRREGMGHTSFGFKPTKKQKKR